MYITYISQMKSEFINYKTLPTLLNVETYPKLLHQQRCSYLHSSAV